MLFSSFEFIFYFLPAVLAAVTLAKMLPYRAELAIILMASLVFYAYANWQYIFLITISACINYAIAVLISNRRNRWLYVVGILFNVLVLCYFKYANFFLYNFDAISGTHYSTLATVLPPLAISFITFEQIAFLSDVYFGKTPPGSPLQYGAFISFFPKLIAGPIIRYEELYPQFVARCRPTIGSIITGLCIFCIGLVKKVGFSDQLNPYIQQIYGGASTGLVSAADAILGTIAYAARIYFDFSGYSDMAIGIAWMMGLALPLNFLSPYKATSLIEFWRRWHITLSRFLRDYIYIPLGGNRRGKIRTYANLLIVMVVGGFWHGAGWTFIIWGAIHGIALMINHAWREVSTKFGMPFEAAAIGWVLTMATVLAGWVFFNASDMQSACNIFLSIAYNWTAPAISGNDLLLILIAWAVILCMPNTAEIFRYKSLRFGPTLDYLKPIPLVWISAAAFAGVTFVASLIMMSSGTVDAFIYFQF